METMDEQHHARIKMKASYSDVEASKSSSDDGDEDDEDEDDDDEEEKEIQENNEKIKKELIDSSHSISQSSVIEENHRVSSSFQEAYDFCQVRYGSYEESNIGNHSVILSEVQESSELKETEDMVYYKEIYDYLTSQSLQEGTAEVHKKILKKRSQNYKVVDGILYYGIRHSRRVITDRLQQNEILKSSHIEEKTGAHLGLKKMYMLINKTFFWKGLYVDIANFVKQCEYCLEYANAQVVTNEKSKQLGELKTTESNSKNTAVGNSNKVWQKVELKIYGPYPKTDLQNEFIITLADPVSHWLIACAIKSNDQANLIADFICKSFCTFGFAKCGIVGVTQEIFEAAKCKYEESVSQIQDTLLTCGLIMPKIVSSCETAVQNLLSLLNDNLSECKWVGRILEEFVEANDDDWDVELERFLFEYCTKCTADSSCPFIAMFGRSPICSIEEDKENCNVMEKDKPFEVLYQRRKLQSSILQCRHCTEMFTSKISFRIHQRKHTEEARRQGMLEGQEPLAPITEKEERLKRRIAVKRKKRLLKQGNLDRREWLLSIANHKLHHSQESLPKDQHREQLQASTVAAVRELLAVTKEERRRRGKYKKYSEEIQEEMARYAIQHGSLETVRHFSQKMGTTVSESTVRDIVKLYRAFTPELKEEIGQFATRFSIDMACSHFTERLGQEVRRGWIRKFKKSYISRHPEIEIKQSNSNKIRNPNGKNDNAVHKNKYTVQLKDEIGAYACQFGVSAAVEHFSQKMSFPPKKCTVRKFKKLYLDKHQTLQQPGTSQQQLQHNNIVSNSNNHEGIGPSTQTIDILHSSLNILNNAQVGGLTSVMYNNPFQSTSLSHIQPVNRLYHSAHGSGSAPYPFHPSNSGGPVMSYPQQIPASSSVMNQNTVGFSHNSVPLQNFQQNRTTFSSYSNEGEEEGMTIVQKSMVPSVLQTVTQEQPFVSQHSTLQQSNLPLTHTSVLNNNYGMALELQHQYPHVPNHSVTVPSYLTDISDEQPRLNSQNQSSVTAVEHIIPPDIGQIHLNQNSQLLQSQQQHHQQEAPQHKEQQIPNNLSELQHQQQVSKLSNKETFSEAKLKSHRDKNINNSECNIEEDSDISLNHEEIPKKRTRHGRSSKKSCSDGQKRGNYTLFSPEIRAEIGKYAAEHGSRRACRHFSEILGHTVPESTICGLRDKYLLMTEEPEATTSGEKEITSLGYGPRGRPRRLGKYDEVVEECIRELVKSGEKVSSFLAIATAKQVLMQFEPGLLEENGGKVKLNITWAKSFLKRIGVNNTS